MSERVHLYDFKIQPTPPRNNKELLSSMLPFKLISTLGNILVKWSYFSNKPWLFENARMSPCTGFMDSPHSEGIILQVQNHTIALHSSTKLDALI